MKAFTYERGEWKENTSLPEMETGEEYYDWLKRCGFKTHSKSFGNEHDSSIDIHESEDGNSYLACVAPFGGFITDVLLPDFPSLMMFIRDFGGSFTLPEIQYKLGEIESLLEKLFRVYHGHDPFNCCRECDPNKWERLQESKGKRNERRQAKQE